MTTWAFDIECYINYFLVMAKNVETREVMTLYERHDDVVTTSFKLIDPATYVSFNGNNYDIPMLSMALTGSDNKTLKWVSDAIIVGNKKPWELEKIFSFRLLELDHIDLIEVAPGMASLKIYGGRMNSKRMQDLPIEPGATIFASDLQLMRDYCANDLDTTIDLYNKLKPQIDLRVAMGGAFGLELRSKSDAQIAEAVIRNQVEGIQGKRIYRPELPSGHTFKYYVPKYIHFQSPGLTKVVDILKDVAFALDASGSVEMPKILESMRLRIGKGVYRMGIGGLHSSETCVSHKATPRTRLVMRDVTSYYPNVILNHGLFPRHLGRDFLTVYRALVEQRIAAKHEGDMITSNSLKICINGSFGKLGSKWSCLYSPDLLIAVTLTGQLALLMLIEILEINGFAVLSANTDGVLVNVPVERTDMFNGLIFAWEFQTGFNTEEAEYAAIYSRDVNNYLAFKTKGGTDTKGVFAETGLSKNATNSICVKAVVDFLREGTPTGDTIRGCVDSTAFLTIRQVKGGAVYGDATLGKAVRWYYAKGETRHIAYKTNGNKVARSDGARPLMTLPDTMPSDIDYDWYIAEANSILCEIGV